MYTKEYLFMDLWRDMCELPPVSESACKWNHLSLEQLIKEQWCSEFECRIIENFSSVWNQYYIEKCKNRMLQGAYKYGTLQMNKHKDPKDTLKNIVPRLKRFWETKDLNLLCDVGNFAHITFYNWYYQGYEFTPTFLPALKKGNLIHTTSQLYTKHVNIALGTHNLLIPCVMFSTAMVLFTSLSKDPAYTFSNTETKKVLWSR